jgi:hypothetical protein
MYLCAQENENYGQKHSKTALNSDVIRTVGGIGDIVSSHDKPFRSRRYRRR